MKYKSEIPKKDQITLNKFPLLPGNEVVMKLNGGSRIGTVTEVGSANPEYVLEGPNAKGAGIVKWNIKDRDDCESFLRGGHLPVKIRLKKSMWAVIRFGKHQKKLYTYEILEALKTK